MISVSSWWYEQAIGRQTPQRELLVETWQGSVYDLGPMVKRWPSIKRRCNEFKVAGFAVEVPLTDVSSAHGFLADLADPYIALTATWRVKVGYVHPASGPEMLTLFTGRTAERTVGQGFGKFKIEAKDARLSESKMGADGTSLWVTYTSPVLGGSPGGATVADIAWTLCTSAGGLDPTESTANVDMNYSRVMSWYATFSETGWQDFMQARGNGQKVAGLLAEVMRQSHSIGWVGVDGRLAFDRRNGLGGRWAPVATLGEDVLLEASFRQPRDLRPTRIFGYMYTVGGDLVNAANAVNIVREATYGRIEDEWQSSNIWHDGTDFIEQAGGQATGGQTNKLLQEADVVLPFLGVLYELGDVVQLSCSAHLVSSYHWTVLASDVDMNDLTVSQGLEERDQKYTISVARTSVETMTLRRPLSMALDVSSVTPASGQVLGWDGSLWSPTSLAASAAANSYTLVSYFNASPTNIADTNGAGAAHWFCGNNRHQHRLDLSAYTQVRFGVHRSSAAANGAGYEVELKYCGSFATDVGSLIQLTTTSRCAFNPTTPSAFYLTGWLTLTTSARADVFLGILAQSGDGAADPNYGMVYAEFRP